MAGYWLARVFRTECSLNSEHRMCVSNRHSLVCVVNSGYRTFIYCKVIIADLTPLIDIYTQPPHTRVPMQHGAIGFGNPVSELCLCVHGNIMTLNVHSNIRTLCYPSLCCRRKSTIRIIQLLLVTPVDGDYSLTFTPLPVTSNTKYHHGNVTVYMHKRTIVGTASLIQLYSNNTGSCQLCGGTAMYAISISIHGCVSMVSKLIW